MNKINRNNLIFQTIVNTLVLSITYEIKYFVFLDIHTQKSNWVLVTKSLD